MKKVLVVLENDTTLDNAHYVERFMRNYEGEIIQLTRFSNRGDSEIFTAISKATDIAVQTCFVNGSDNQLYEMIELLSKIPNPINIYIKYLGLSNNNELREYFIDVLTANELFSVEHHNIYAMGDVDYEIPHELLDFKDVTNIIHENKRKEAEHAKFLEEYKRTAKERPTGRKIKVLGCDANGKAFQNLPIGEVVDELECVELQTNKTISRGVWIWGNGEPIMLVNDNPPIVEYEVMVSNINDILIELTICLEPKRQYTAIELNGMKAILEDNELSPNDKGNIICDDLGIERRGNRQLIKNLLNSLELSV